METVAGYPQEAWWRLYRADPATALGNVPLILSLRGPLESDLLDRSLNVLISRHEVLRSCLSQRGDHLLQLIEPALTVDLPVVDLRSAVSAERDRLARTLIVDEVRAPFDLTKPPLLRARLYRLDDLRHVLALTVHHSICDAWTSELLRRELFVVYNALARGQVPQLEPARQYREFADWQHGWRDNQELRRQFDYWISYLDSADPTVRLPLLRERAAVDVDRTIRRPAALGPQSWRAVVQIGRQERVAPFAVVLAALCVCLSPYASGELLFGMVHANRTRRWTMRMLGILVNDVWLRVRFDDNPTIAQLVQRSWTAIRGAMRNGEVPFEEVARHLGIRTGPDRKPAFETWINWVGHNPESPPAAAAGTDGLVVGSFPVDLSEIFSDVVRPWDGIMLRIELATLPDAAVAGTVAFNAEILDAFVVDGLISRLGAVVERLPAVMASRLAIVASPRWSPA